LQNLLFCRPIINIIIDVTDNYNNYNVRRYTARLYERNLRLNIFWHACIYTI